MKDEHTYGVILADNDPGFMKVLKVLLNEITGKRGGMSIRIAEVNSLAKALAQMDKQTDMVVMHDVMIINDKDVFLKMLDQKGKNCKLVILLSHEGDGKVFELMHIIEKAKGALPDLHLLRDNHSLGVMILFLEDVLNQAGRTGN